MAWRRGFLAIVLPSLLGACSPLVRYTNDLVDSRSGRTWFTRAPAGIGGTFGFTLGIPIDIVAMPVLWGVYRFQPKEERDVMSVFLFPSFVLWKVGTLVGMPFDFVEWATWRSWHETVLTQDERETIERLWDSRGYSEYPVTPIYPRVPEKG